MTRLTVHTPDRLAEAVQWDARLSQIPASDVIRQALVAYGQPSDGEKLTRRVAVWSQLIHRSLGTCEKGDS